MIFRKLVLKTQIYTMSKNKNKIIDLIKREFKIKKKLQLKNYKIGDFEKWDSLGNLNLLMLIEDEFNIRFTLTEMSNLNNVNAIEKALKKK